MFGFKKKKLELAMPVDGKIISLAEVPDEVFSTGMMGQGFAIEPSSDEIYAPVAGTITNIFPTKTCDLTQDKRRARAFVAPRA